MSVRLRRYLALLPLAAVVLLPALAFAASVQPLFNLSSPTGGPFPSDRFTALDLRNNTLLRVNLPKPDCTIRVTDCQDLDVINTLDGFNLQPRLSIPFSGAIDVTSVTSRRSSWSAWATRWGGMGARSSASTRSSGSEDQNTARRIGRVPRPAHALPAGRDHRCEERRRHADRTAGIRRLPGQPPL
jgi:hypothetical protein